MTEQTVLNLTKEELATVRFALQYASDMLALNVHHVPDPSEANTARLRHIGRCRVLLEMLETPK